MLRSKNLLLRQHLPADEQHATVRQPLDEMGRRTMSILMEWVQTHRETQQGEILPTALIPRASTARLAKALV